MTPQLGALRIDFLAAGNAELFTHQINARYFLGNRVLNLQAGVHLQEGNRSVGGKQELAGTRTLVSGFLQNLAGCFIEPVALFFRKVWGGGFLYELLVTALKRTITGRNDLHITVSIGQALGFNMARRI